MAWSRKTKIQQGDLDSASGKRRRKTWHYKCLPCVSYFILWMIFLLTSGRNFYKKIWSIFHLQLNQNHEQCMNERHWINEIYCITFLIYEKNITNQNTEMILQYLQITINPVIPWECPNVVRFPLAKNVHK